jgi:tRNA(Ile)-lysidine synthase
MELVLPKPGRYVLAVSGGVDSMVLLDMLRQRQAEDKAWKLTVAHLDHGIRAGSAEDRQLVQAVAQGHGLPFVYHEARLGVGASEAEARQARYGFLRGVQRAAGAQAIITAHHQDDVLETAIINLLRGSGRKGLSALDNRHDLLRPLLRVLKRELAAYAKDQGLVWHEDSTNENEAYLRNYVRRRLLPRFDDAARARLWQLVGDMRAVNYELDALLATQLHLQTVAGTLDRYWFNGLPHAVAREVMAAWLRAHDVRNFDSKSLERLVVAAKVAAPGKVFPVLAGYDLRITADYLALNRPER